MASTRQPNSAQRGAALLIAMLVLTLVATVASAMVWHQQRAIEIEAAERARAQAGLVLAGGLDWARLQIRAQKPGDAFVNNQGFGHPMENLRLSSFLSVDREHNADSTLEAFLSGQITDAQDRYNLRRLINNEGKPVPAELEGLRRLCDAAGVGKEVADQLAEGLAAAWFGRDTNAAIAPSRIDQLRWLGIDATTLERLTPFLIILPSATSVNANNAPEQVLVAAVDDLKLEDARQLVRNRPLAGLDDQALTRLLPPNLKLEGERIGVRSRFFEVRGTLRLDDRVLEDRWLVEARPGGSGMEVVPLRRERRSLHEATP